jgi:hypothetical protein
MRARAAFASAAVEWFVLGCRSGAFLFLGARAIYARDREGGMGLELTVG